MGLGDADVGQEQRDRLRDHRRAAIRMHGELARLDALPLAALGDQLLGDGGQLARRHRPAHHVAAEHVEQHVEVVVGPLGRPQQPGDVPAPQLVRPARQQLGRGVVRMTELVAPLADLGVRGQHAMQRALRAQVAVFVEQRRVDFCRRQAGTAATRLRGQLPDGEAVRTAAAHGAGHPNQVATSA